MSHFLTEEDVRSMIRLVGEVAMIEGDHAAKKRYLMDGLCDLIGADKWAWGLSCRTVEGSPQVYVNFLFGGMTEVEVPRLLKAVEHPDMAWVIGDFFKEIEEKKTHLTRLRSEIVADSEFLKTEAFDYWKEADIGPVIMSVRPLDGESGSTVALYRRFGKPMFSIRESKIAHIILTEVPWLHELGWPEDRGVSVPRLYPQQRIVLNLLLQGEDRKSIASQLDISINTVSGYVKELYQHFNVNSQSELLARFFSGNGGDR
ncbi:MAG: hypothetical protein HC904_17245 [Blastochloris sp.]|nr:hypothetical protein [Blastochloris sp.]